MQRQTSLYRRLLDREYSWLHIMLLALVLRLGLLVMLGNEPLVSDSLYYHESAINWVETGQIDTYWPPGLPAYEALWVWVLGKSEILARLAMLPWFFWLCRHFYQIAYRLHSRPAANMGLLILTFYPAFIHQSVEPLSYLPAAAILLATFGQMLAYLEERKRGRIWRIGLLIGLLILFRPSAAIFLLAMPPLILLRRRKFLPGFGLLLYAVLTVAPWVWLASSQSGRFVAINDANSRNFYLGNNAWTPSYKTWYYGSHWTAHPDIAAGFRAELQAVEALPPAEQGSAYARLAWADIGARPGPFALRTAARVRTLLAFDSFAGARLRWSGHAWAPAGYALLCVEAAFYLLVVLSLLGFWFSELRRELSGGTQAIMAGFLLLFALPYWFSFSHPTYHLPLLPLMLLPASVMLQQVWAVRELPELRPRQSIWFWVAVLALVAIQVEWIIQMLLIRP